LTKESSFIWNTEIGNWSNYYKTEYEYDHMMSVHESRYLWNEVNNTWDGASKLSYTYNQSQLESEIYSIWNATDQWIEKYRDEYKYAGDGLLNELVSSEKDTPYDEWRFTDRTLFEYDTFGQPILLTHFYYPFNGDWTLNARTNITYDSSGNITEILSEIWSPENNLWQPSTHAEYTYDMGGYETGYFWYHWNEIDQIWEGFYGGTAAYNEFGDYTERVDLGWNDIKTDWEPYSKIEYEYDHSISFENILWPYPNEDPYVIYQRMPTSTKGYIYEEDWEPTSSSRLRYSIRTSTLNLTIDPLTISPNPASDFIQFSIPDIQEGSTLKLYSPDGKLMISTSTYENTKVSTSGLTPGWYIARIQNGKDLYIGKFVKE